MAQTAKEQIGVDLPDSPPVEIPEQVEPEPVRPDGLPEKFGSMDEYNNSYRELEDELRRRGENQNQLQAQISQLTEMVEGLQEQSYQQPQQQQGIDPGLKAQLMESFENDPIGTIAYLNQQYTDYRLDQRLAQLQEENNPYAQQQAVMQNQMLAITVERALNERLPDWGDYKERVASEVEGDNTLLPPEALQSPEQTIRSLTRVYEMVKARDVLEGQQNGNFVTTEMKRQAQTLPGTTGRPGEPTPEDEKIAQLMQAAQGLSYSSWRSSQG